MALDFSSLESSIVKQFDGVKDRLELEFGPEILGSIGSVGQEYFEGVEGTKGAVCKEGELAGLDSGKQEHRRGTLLPSGGGLDNCSLSVGHELRIEKGWTVF